MKRVLRRCTDRVRFNVITGMSFCRGSVNCHLSDGKMDHVYESPKSVEIFTEVEGGGGSWWSPIHVVN